MLRGKEIEVEFDEHGDIVKQVQNSEPVEVALLPSRTLTVPSRRTGTSSLMVTLIGFVSVGIIIIIIGFFAVMQLQSTNTPIKSPQIVSESSSISSTPVKYSDEQPTQLPDIPLASPTTAPPARPTATSPLPDTIQTDPDEDLIENVIRQYNSDQTAAVRNLDVQILQATCTGNCYAVNRDYIDELTQNNLYEVQEQLAFEVVSISISGNTATVVTNETWRTFKYDHSTNDCRYHQPTFHTRQTYILIREGNQWKISQNDFDAPNDVPGC